MTVMCEVLEVSRSGFYAWRSRPESKRSKHHRELMVEMKRRVDAGEIGEIRMITSDFGYRAGFNPASRIFDPARETTASLPREESTQRSSRPFDTKRVGGCQPSNPNRA